MLSRRGEANIFLQLLEFEVREGGKHRQKKKKGDNKSVPGLGWWKRNRPRRRIFPVGKQNRQGGAIKDSQPQHCWEGKGEGGGKEPSTSSKRESLTRGMSLGKWRLSDFDGKGSRRLRLRLFGEGRLNAEEVCRGEGDPLREYKNWCR